MGNEHGKEAPSSGRMGKPKKSTIDLKADSGWSGVLANTSSDDSGAKVREESPGDGHRSVAARALGKDKKLSFLKERGRVDSVDMVMGKLLEQSRRAEQNDKSSPKSDRRQKYGKLANAKPKTNAEAGRKALLKRRMERKHGTKGGEKGVFDSADYFMNEAAQAGRASKKDSNGTGSQRRSARRMLSPTESGYRKTAKHFLAEGDRQRFDSADYSMMSSKLSRLKGALESKRISLRAATKELNAQAEFKQDGHKVAAKKLLGVGATRKRFDSADHFAMQQRMAKDGKISVRTSPRTSPKAHQLQKSMHAGQHLLAKRALENANARERKRFDSADYFSSRAAASKPPSPPSQLQKSAHIGQQMLAQKALERVHGTSGRKRFDSADHYMREKVGSKQQAPSGKKYGKLGTSKKMTGKKEKPKGRAAAQAILDRRRKSNPRKFDSATYFMTKAGDVSTLTRVPDAKMSGEQTPSFATADPDSENDGNSSDTSRESRGSMEAARTIMNGRTKRPSNLQRFDSASYFMDGSKGSATT